MAKLSSRVDAEQSIAETLTDILGVVKGALRLIDTDLPTDQNELLIELDSDVIDLAEEHKLFYEANLSLTADLLIAAAQRTEMLIDLAVCAEVLEALSEPPTDDQIIERAFNVLRREGQADMELEQDVTNDTGLLMNVKLTFDEDRLREALRTAIETYNNDLAASILKS